MWVCTSHTVDIQNWKARCTDTHQIHTDLLTTPSLHDVSYLGWCQMDEAGQMLPLRGGQIFLLLESPLQLVNLRMKVLCNKHFKVSCELLRLNLMLMLTSWWYHCSWHMTRPLSRPLSRPPSRCLPCVSTNTIVTSAPAIFTPGEYKEGEMI